MVRVPSLHTINSWSYWIFNFKMARLIELWKLYMFLEQLFILLESQFVSRYLNFLLLCYQIILWFKALNIWLLLHDRKFLDFPLSRVAYSLTPLIQLFHLPVEMSIVSGWACLWHNPMLPKSRLLKLNLISSSIILSHFIDLALRNRRYSILNMLNILLQFMPILLSLNDLVLVSLPKLFILSPSKILLAGVLPLSIKHTIWRQFIKILLYFF